MTGRRNDFPDFRMQWGLDHEYRAVDAVELEGDVLYSNTGKRQRSHFMDSEGYKARNTPIYRDVFPAGEWSYFLDGYYKLRATPDGLSIQPNDDRLGLECKCPQDLHDEPRPQIICQAQFQMFVCDLKHVTLIEWTYHGYRAWQIEPSAGYIAWAMPMVDEFMCYLRDDKEPPRFKPGTKPVPPEVEWKLQFEVLKDDIAF